MGYLRVRCVGKNIGEPAPFVKPFFMNYIENFTVRHILK